MEVNSGALAILSIMAVLKIAVYLSVLVLAFLIDIVSKKDKHIHGLNLMALVFVVLAFTEFIHITSVISEGAVFSWFAVHENAHLLEGPLLLIGGLGIIWYLIGIKKNIEDYK